MKQLRLFGAIITPTAFYAGGCWIMTADGIRWLRPAESRMFIEFLEMSRLVADLAAHYKESEATATRLNQMTRSENTRKVRSSAEKTGWTGSFAQLI